MSISAAFALEFTQTGCQSPMADIGYIHDHSAVTESCHENKYVCNVANAGDYIPTSLLQKRTCAAQTTITGNHHHQRCTAWRRLLLISRKIMINKRNKCISTKLQFFISWPMHSTHSPSLTVAAGREQNPSCAVYICTSVVKAAASETRSGIGFCLQIGTLLSATRFFGLEFGTVSIS